MAKKAATKKESEKIAPITINADQLSFNHDKEIDNLARYLEERIPKASGLDEVVRAKNVLSLTLSKKVSKRDVKQYVTKFLHRAGLRLDYRCLATYQEKDGDFMIYPRKVYEI
ncbi:MAG: 60S ribosomal protein L22 [Candidatus Lokiarchaeota archaeon]|nr:60S ribosomal protein L22 [Candidatus Lokiarchaeota archaeon]